MIGRLILILTLVGMLAGCASIAESRFNPFNWFGRGQEAETLAPGERPADPRPLVDQVTELVVERVPGGAIVRARGLPPTQGYYDGALVSETRNTPEDGVLTYQFRIVEPATPQRVSTVRSREVIVGLFLSDQTLEGVRSIRVEAARNARVARR